MDLPWFFLFLQCCWFIYGDFSRVIRFIFIMIIYFNWLWFFWFFFSKVTGNLTRSCACVPVHYSWSSFYLLTHLVYALIIEGLVQCQVVKLIQNYHGKQFFLELSVVFDCSAGCLLWLWLWVLVFLSIGFWFVKLEIFSQNFLFFVEVRVIDIC